MTIILGCQKKKYLSKEKVHGQPSKVALKRLLKKAKQTKIVLRNKNLTSTNVCPNAVSINLSWKKKPSRPSDQ